MTCGHDSFEASYIIQQSVGTLTSLGRSYRPSDIPVAEPSDQSIGREIEALLLDDSALGVRVAAVRSSRTTFAENEYE
jgi:hypothetical protein